MGRGSDNGSGRWRTIGSIMLDTLLIVLTFGLIVWYRAARARHRIGGNSLNTVTARAGVMDHRTEYRSELRTYIAGFVLAVLLTVPPFAFVAWHGASRATLLWLIAGAAVVQIAAHLRFFLHVNLSKSKRDDLHLILFSILIVVMMAGGTIWILGNLRYRMM